jgi:hypothetical protein
MQGLLDCLHLSFNLTGILHAISSLAAHITYNWQSTMKLTHSSLCSKRRRHPIFVFKSELVAKLCEELALVLQENMFILEMCRSVTFQLALDIKLWLVTDVLALVQ